MDQGLPVVSDRQVTFTLSERLWDYLWSGFQEAPRPQTWPWDDAHPMGLFGRSPARNGEGARARADLVRFLGGQLERVRSPAGPPAAAAARAAGAARR